MNWLDRAIGSVAPARRCAAPGSGRRWPSLARGYEGARVGRRTEGWVAAGTGANAEIGPGARPAARPLARSGAQQPLRRQGGAGAGQQPGRHRHPAAGARRRCRCCQRQADRLWARVRRSLRRRRTHRLLRPAGADRPRHGRERRGAGAPPRAADRGRPAGAAAAAGAGAGSPRCQQDRRSAERRLRRAGDRVRRARPAARLLAVPDASRRGRDVPLVVASQPVPASIACCTCSTGCGRGRCAACRGSRR